MILGYSDNVGAETARRMRHRRQMLAGYSQGLPDVVGGAVAAVDDTTPDSQGKPHSPAHAIAVGVATALIVHVAVEYIDRWLGFKR